MHSDALHTHDAPVQRLGLNRTGYRGETITPKSVLEPMRRAAQAFGWTIETFPYATDQELMFLHRPALRPSSAAAPIANLYLSAGIHGDEPASPLAAVTLLRENRWPVSANLWFCPCLNPRGLGLSTRENPEGIDLNRDYRDPSSPEVKIHCAWLERQPKFDLSLCLHEDWEAAGFYCYELNVGRQASVAERIVEAVRRVCPIETGAMVDGRPTDAPGIVRPKVDPNVRPDWPEALWLMQRGVPQGYTLEAPSDFPLATRVAALVEGVRAVLTTPGWFAA